MAVEKKRPRPPQFRAKHLDAATGEMKMRIDLPVYLGLEDAATAIALTYRAAVPSRFGQRTAYEGVLRAVESGYRGGEVPGVDPEAVEFYKEKLIELEVFPPPRER